MGSDGELNEKNFIQERDSKFLWTFLILFLVFITLMWGIDYWQRAIARKVLKNSPFFQVTNRAFSIFLWQNPEFMRIHLDFSESYLPHFHSRDNVHMIPEFAEEYVIAPPEVLYRYHTWKRLIGDFVTGRPIYKDTFLSFLDDNTEWYPRLWKNAPPAYKKLIEELPGLDVSNLQTLSYDQLPLEVRMAFFGWFNYTREWEEINLFIPSQVELENFLALRPHYARNYWRNLVPDYLLNQEKGTALTWFLKSAAFNFAQLQNRPDR